MNRLFDPEGTEGATRGEKVHAVELFGEGDGPNAVRERRRRSQSLPLRKIRRMSLGLQRSWFVGLGPRANDS